MPIYCITSYILNLWLFETSSFNGAGCSLVCFVLCFTLVCCVCVLCCLSNGKSACVLRQLNAAICSLDLVVSLCLFSSCGSMIPTFIILTQTFPVSSCSIYSLCCSQRGTPAGSGCLCCTTITLRVCNLH